MKEFIRLFRFSRNLKKYYLAIFGLSILVALLAQVSPIIQREIINSITGAEGFDGRIFALFGVILAAFLLSNILGNINGYFGDLLTIKLKQLLSNKYYERLMLLPQSYFDNEHTGTVIGRLERSITSITTFVKQMSNLFFNVLVTSIVSFSIIAYYTPLVAILLAVLFPVYLYFTNKASKWWQGVEKDILSNQDEANGRFAEVIGQVRVTKSFTQEKTEQDFYKSKFRNMVGLTRKQSIRWHIYDGYRTFSQDIVLVVSMAFVIWQAFEGNLSIGDVFMLSVLINQATTPLRFISFMIDNLQRMISSSKDYFETMATELDEINQNTKPIKVKKAEIEFRSLNFAYPDNPDKSVLSDINFVIKPGQKLALVGESGEGKSTITSLLMGFYQPSFGKILIDGQDISKVDPTSLRKNIGVVFQDPSLFSGSIYDNIAYARPGATEKEVLKAAKAANADEFISNLADGYQSEIGERGIKLSGGQKQRIAIARAILKDAPILILDEATSSLDSKSELIVQDALSKLMKGRTTLVIAHRLSTIADVNTIVTLKDGSVDEVGSPKQLAKTDGIYAQLLELQDSKSKISQNLLKQFEIVA